MFCPSGHKTPPVFSTECGEAAARSFTGMEVHSHGVMKKATKKFRYNDCNKWFACLGQRKQVSTSEENYKGDIQSINLEIKAIYIAVIP